jgi:hypothetical protein
MIDNYKVVVVTPAGRKRYLELLIPQIVALKPYVDEYRLWANTTDEEDLKYMEEVAQQYPEFVVVEPLTVKHDGSMSIYSFFKNCVDEDTVYVRFDDDVILIDSPSAFTDLVRFRIANPQYFLVYGNIMNNAISSHIHQRLGNLNLDAGVAAYKCTDELGWNNPRFAANVHLQVLDGPLSRFHFAGKWDLFDYERVSINCISWLGSNFAKFDGVVGFDEEQWLSVDKPKESQQMNCIFGGFVCVHYAFYTQRAYMDKTDVLNLYKERIGSDDDISIANLAQRVGVDLDALQSFVKEPWTPPPAPLPPSHKVFSSIPGLNSHIKRWVFRG